MNLTIAIDDVNPLKDWRILGDITEKYLFDLNKKFGAKFTLFIPSNYHNEAPISEHKEWINELNSSGIFELAAHGHFHQTVNPDRFGECEFYELAGDEIIEHRIHLMFEEWDKVGIKPKGWRNPGWLCSWRASELLSKHFDWVALHYEHNRGLIWNGCKEIFGSDGIHKNDITLHSERVMLHSHIFGDWNDNVWNEDNYKQANLSLEFLCKYHDIEFKTMSEL